MPDGPDGEDQNHKVGDDVHHDGDDVARADIYAMTWDTGIPDLLARYALADYDDDGDSVEGDIGPD